MEVRVPIVDSSRPKLAKVSTRNICHNHPFEWRTTTDKLMRPAAVAVSEFQFLSSEYRLAVPERLRLPPRLTPDPQYNNSMLGGQLLGKLDP